MASAASKYLQAGEQDSMEAANLCMGCMNEKGAEHVCPSCGWIEGTIPDMPQHLQPRSVLNNRYLIGRVLGQGGFGITYLAWDLTLNTRLAIKEYLPQSMATRYAGDTSVVPYSSAAAKDGFQYGLDRFLEEARTLARFSENPNIVSVRDYFAANGTAYLVMAYIDGITFKQYIAERGNRIGYQAALTIMLPVMEALEEVHSVGLLHRDISPDNIFITRGNQVKILDFGAARYAIGEQSRSLSVILKAGYAPEEQYRSKGVQGPWTDIYASAATFYRALTGTVPPEALDRMHEDSLTPPSQVGVALPPPAEEALLKALAVLAANRFQKMKDFRDSLQAAGPSLNAAVQVPVQPVNAPSIEATRPLAQSPPDPNNNVFPLVQPTAPLLAKPENSQAGWQPAAAASPGPVLDKGSSADSGKVSPGVPLDRTMPAAEFLSAGIAQAPAFSPDSIAGQTPPFGANTGSSYEPGAYSPGGMVAQVSSPGNPAVKKGKKPVLIALGALVLVVLLAAGIYGISRWSGAGTASTQKATKLVHVLNKPDLARNDIKNIIIAEGFDEAKFEATRPVEQYLSSQKRFHAVVRFIRGLRGKATGNWYFLGGGQRQLISSFDITGTGTEKSVWFWYEPVPPVPEGQWEFEAVLATGVKKSVTFVVAHDPALDVKPDTTDYSDNNDYSEPEYNPPDTTVDEPVDESYDFTQ